MNTNELLKGLDFLELDLSNSRQFSHPSVKLYFSEEGKKKINQITFNSGFIKQVAQTTLENVAFDISHDRVLIAAFNVPDKVPRVALAKTTNKQSKDAAVKLNLKPYIKKIFEHLVDAKDMKKYLEQAGSDKNETRYVVQLHWEEIEARRGGSLRVFNFTAIKPK